nr:ADP-ribosyltransferase [Pseudoclavibacter sp. Marseille-Q3772]
MLASRGWVYHSKETAGINGGYHDRCNCQIVPSWGAGKAHLEGYDPDDLYEKYMAARAELEAEGVRSPSDKEVAARMQKLFPERYATKQTVDTRKDLDFVDATKDFAFTTDRTLTADEEDHIFEWTTGSYREINRHLRFGDAVSGELQETASVLDRVLGSRELGRDLRLYRREEDIRWMGVDRAYDVSSLVGQEMTLKGFTSTTFPENREVDPFGENEI